MNYRKTNTAEQNIQNNRKKIVVRQRQKISRIIHSRFPDQVALGSEIIGNIIKLGKAASIVTKLICRLENDLIEA